MADLLDLNWTPGRPRCDHQSTLSDEPVEQALTRLNSRWLLPLVGVAAALLCLPFVRTVYWLGDEGVLLHGAERMLQGHRLYIDFFEFLPPGGFVLTASWLLVTGISICSARILAILVVVGIACFTYLACWRASKHAPLSAVLVIGWVIMSQGLMTQVNHHWFTTLFSVVAAWAALTGVETTWRWPRWPLIAGTAAGAAAMVTPTCGALAMLAAATAFLNRRWRTELIAYLVGGAIVPVSLIIWLIGYHAFGAAFDDVILFTGARYASIQGVPFGSWADLQNYPLKYLFPVTGLLTIIVYARDRRIALRDPVPRLCVAFGLAGFVGCFPRPDIYHIAFAAPLAGPLLAYCIASLTERWRSAYRTLGFGLMIGLCVPSVLAFSWISREASRGETVRTSRGDVVFSRQSGVPEMLVRIAGLPSGDVGFFYPFAPMLPFLTAREDASRYSVFTPGYTLPSQYQDTCISMMRRASFVVIDRRWTDPGNLKFVFPAMIDAQPPETKAFEQALDSGFDFVAREGPFELRERRQGTGETLCTGITGAIGTGEIGRNRQYPRD